MNEVKSREFEIKELLEEKRKNIKTLHDLVLFLQEIKRDYNCGYGEAPRSIAQAALATAWYFASDFGITGFQAGFVMWDFIQGWLFEDNKCGMKIIDYDDMLYPQYNDKFEKVLSKETFEALQKEAKKKLESHKNECVHSAVWEHWKSIANGNVPFGYVVKDE